MMEEDDMMWKTWQMRYPNDQSELGDRGCLTCEQDVIAPEEVRQIDADCFVEAHFGDILARQCEKYFFITLNLR